MKFSKIDWLIFWNWQVKNSRWNKFLEVFAEVHVQFQATDQLNSMHFLGECELLISNVGFKIVWMNDMVDDQKSGIHVRLMRREWSEAEISDFWDSSIFLAGLFLSYQFGSYKYWFLIFCNINTRRDGTNFWQPAVGINAIKFAKIYRKSKI